jgi:hypothetical protein
VDYGRKNGGVPMSQLPFKISAWTPDGNHVEEELGEFANLVVATESWHAFVGYYAKRRMTLRHGARSVSLVTG